MYSRDFGGVKSDGQLRELQDNLQQQYEHKENGQQYAQEDFVHTYEQPPEPRAEEEKKSHWGLTDIFKSSFDFDFLKNIKIDDLVLIGIGLLILFGKEEHNTLILILIALLIIL